MKPRPLTPIEKRLNLAHSRPSFLKDWKKMRFQRTIAPEPDRVVDGVGRFYSELRAKQKLRGLANPQAERSDVA